MLPTLIERFPSRGCDSKHAMRRWPARSGGSLLHGCLVAAGLILLTSATADAPVSAAPVDPIIPGLRDTGVDEDDKKLKKCESDPHYRVSGPVGGDAIVVSPSDLPDDWINRQDSSQWISIAEDAI